MNTKRLIAAASVALIIGGCGGGSDSDEPRVTDSPVTPFVNVADKAEDLAGSVNQRNADLESQFND